jgi:hypothetical protein
MADQREAAEMLRHILDAVDRGELTADTPEERRNVRRLEGMLAVLAMKDRSKKHSRATRRASEPLV